MEAKQTYREGDVRIVYLPPCTVAAAHHVGGGGPEDVTRAQIGDFVRQADLFAHKPDTRLFGFNHPNGEKPDGSDRGYETWVTIPGDMPVPPPLVKKQFPGGTYAARTIPLGAFEEWDNLDTWVRENGEYVPNLGPVEVMSGLMEEQLDYIHQFQLPPEEQLKTMQLDLLFPVKKAGT